MVNISMAVPVSVCRYYYQGECVETCPDGYFKSTLLPGSSSETATASWTVEDNAIMSPPPSDGVDELQSSRQCVPCHWSCAVCVGQLSTDCVQCRRQLLWSHGRCLHTCDFLSVCLITDRVARTYRFCLVCVCVCVCVSVRVPKADNFTTTSHFAFTWEGLTYSRMSVCPSVRPARVSVRGFLPPAYPYPSRRAVRSSLADSSCANIPWGHSGHLCHALSLSLSSSWTSMRRRRQ